MKQLSDEKICKYCMGCNRLLIETFDGVINCKNFIQGKDMSKYYEKLKEVKKNGMQT